MTTTAAVVEQPLNFIDTLPTPCGEFWPGQRVSFRGRLAWFIGWDPERKLITLVDHLDDARRTEVNLLPFQLGATHSPPSAEDLAAGVELDSSPASVPAGSQPEAASCPQEAPEATDAATDSPAGVEPGYRGSCGAGGGEGAAGDQPDPVDVATDPVDVATQPDPVADYIRANAAKHHYTLSLELEAHLGVRLLAPEVLRIMQRMGLRE